MANKITPAGNVRFVPQTARADVASMGGGGKGLISAGQDISGFGDFVAEKTERDSKSYADLTYMEGRSEWAERLKTSEAAAVAGADGFTKTVKDDFDTWSATKLGSDKLTSTAKKHLAKQLESLKGTLVGKAVDFETVSRTRLNVLNTKNTLSAGINAAYQDIQMFTGSLEQGLETIKDSRISNDAKLEVEREFREDLAYRTLVGEVHRDPDSVIEMLTGDYWQTQLSPAGLSQITLSANNKKNQLDAKALNQQNKSNTAFRIGINSVRERLIGGFGVSSSEMTQLTTLGKLSDDPIAHANLTRLHAFKDWRVEASKMSVPEVNAFLTAGPQQGQPATELEFMQVKAARSILSKKTTEANAAGRDMIAALLPVAELGELPIKDVVMIQALIPSIDDPDVLRKMTNLVNEGLHKGWVAKSDLTLANTQAHVAAFSLHAERTDGISTVEAETIKLHSAYLKEMQNVLTKKGPISWAAQSGNMDIPPIDIKSSSSLKDRFTAANEAKNKYGVENYQFFLPEELSQVQTAIFEMDANQRVELYRTIVGTGGPDSYKVFNELSEKGASGTGYVAGMASHDQHLTIALEIEQGRKTLEQPNGSKNLPSSGLREVFNTEIGDAFMNMPNHVKEGMYAALEGLYVKRGLPSGTVKITNSDVKKLIKEVHGGTIIPRNNSRLVLPIGKTEEYFENAVTSLDNEEIMLQVFDGVVPVNQQGNTVTGEKLLSNSHFRYVGDGQYRVQHKGTNKYLRHPGSNKVLIMDLNKLENYYESFE
tara:strand:+ start:260 stop:2563 length:2304 start_codon:yes stop_codon:yes gene_type:complete